MEAPASKPFPRRTSGRGKAGSVIQARRAVECPALVFTSAGGWEFGGKETSGPGGLGLEQRRRSRRYVAGSLIAETIDHGDV